MVSKEKFTPVHIAFPPWVSQLSGIFVFVFQKFDYDVPWLGFHWVPLIWGSFSSWIRRFVSFAKFQGFPVVASLNSFSPFPFFSPWGLTAALHWVLGVMEGGAGGVLKGAEGKVGSLKSRSLEKGSAPHSPPVNPADEFCTSTCKAEAGGPTAITFYQRSLLAAWVMTNCAIMSTRLRQCLPDSSTEKALPPLSILSSLEVKHKRNGKYGALLEDGASTQIIL